MLRKMVRDRACHPALRGVLDSLLRYLTQDLPTRAAPDRNLKKPQIGGSDQGTENSGKLRSSCEDGTSGDLLPRPLTTFQLLQSKFMWSGSKAPATHRREVGSLSSSRGATSHLKNSKGDDPEPKSQTRRGQGHKRGSSVKDIVARFAMAEHKGHRGNWLRIQSLKPRLAGRGPALSSLMERFEAVATVRKGSAVARVRLWSDVKQMVACHERRQRQRVDENVHRETQPRKTRFQPDSKGRSSSRGQEQRLGPSTRQKGPNPGKNHLKPEDQSSNQSEEHPGYDKTNTSSAPGGEIQSRSEEVNIVAPFKYGRLMVLHLKSVTETILPEPYKLVSQVEAQMKCHVGTIVASSPVWATCVVHSPELHPAEPSEIAVRPPGGAAENGSCLNPPGEEEEEEEEERGAEGDSLNLPESRTGQRSGPGYPIPRVSTCTFPQEGKDHACSSQLPAADPERNLLKAAQLACWGSLDTGPVACPLSETEKTLLPKTKKDSQTQDKRQGKEEKTKERMPVVTGNTNTQLSEETNDEAAPEGTAPAGSSSGAHCGADDQKSRPKYKTINYGDPSVKGTYKPKIIRIADTFTF